MSFYKSILMGGIIMKPDLSVKIAGMLLQNSMMNGAGTFAASEGCKKLFQCYKWGAVVPKTVTLKERNGNPQPRIWEVAGGIINCIGMQNSGVNDFVSNKVFEYADIGAPIIASIAGESIDEFIETALIIEKRAGRLISALELNVSCPNVSDGTIFGSDPKLLFSLVRSLKLEIGFPIIVKLTPNVTDIGQMAKAAQNAGADALSLINTVKARAPISSGPNKGKEIAGGLSGPVIKPIAYQKVWEVSQASSLPLITMGGICNVKDALEFLRIKNVKGISVGTASFINPRAIIEIINGIDKYFKEKRYNCFEEFKEKEVV